jgi:hypothetical protein
LVFVALPGLGAGAAAAAESEGGAIDRGQKSGRGFDRIATSVVFIDPQNDVLSEKGAAGSRSHLSWCRRAALPHSLR